VYAVLEAGSELTNKVGGNFVKLEASGVTIVGPAVKMNAGGAAGNGTGASPLLPLISEIPAVPPCPCPECIRQAADGGEAFVDGEDA